MMREILFRGKRKGCARWVYGFLTMREFKTPAIFVPSEKERLEYAEPFGVTYCVDPDTVGQFTGLTDKNGKKIFEGDIVDCWSEGVNAKGTVQQRNDGLWIIYPAWQKTIMWGLCPDEYCHTIVEVIGNIHDNPDLIELPKKEGEV